MSSVRCFYCQEISEPETGIELSKSDYRHLFNTLRAKSGDEIKLIDGKGTIAKAVVSDNQQINILSKQVLDFQEVRLHLYVAPPRRQKMDQLLRQCAEIGVATINPILTERSVAIPNLKKSGERWGNLLIEACKQAENPFLPQINSCVSFSEAIGELATGNRAVFFGSVKSGESSADFRDTGQDVAWIVGPEGGFSPAEETAMLDKGFTPLRIAEWTLRVETAAVTGATLLLFAHRKVNLS